MNNMIKTFSRVLFGIFLSALFILPAYALPQDVSAVCGSNNTLVFSISSLRCINGVCKVIENNSTIVCQYGCNDNAVPNECSPAPSQVNILFYLGAVIFMIFVAGIYKYFKSR